MGAWIETKNMCISKDITRVAPLVGAWIETYLVEIKKQKIKSHPSWVRGLKRGYMIRIKTENPVAPLVGAWIETWYG